MLNVQRHIITSQPAELHMIGEYVAVRWNLKKEQRELKGDDGLTYKAVAYVRSSGPYISFASIRKINGEEFVDEDSPVDGGISAEFAKEILPELQWAIDYIDRKGWNDALV